MRIVRFTAAAEADLTEALDWYDAQSAGLGDRLLAELEAAKDRVAENPLQFPVIYKVCRRALLRRFPYALFFRLRGNDLQVIACFHMRRNPRRWRSRL